MTATGQTRLVCAQKAKRDDRIELLLKIDVARARVFARCGHLRGYLRYYRPAGGTRERAVSPLAQLMWESGRNFSNVNPRFEGKGSRCEANNLNNCARHSECN